MPLSTRRRSSSERASAWPGWVDGLSSLLMVVIFVLLIFTIAQFTLQATLGNRDQELRRLVTENEDLARTLVAERQEADRLTRQLGSVNQQLAAAEDEVTDLARTAEDLTRQLAQQVVLERQLVELRTAREAAQAELAALRLVAQDYRDQLTTASGDRQALEAQLAEARRLVAEREEALTTLQTTLAITEEERQTLLAQLSELTRERERLSTALSSATAELATLTPTAAQADTLAADLASTRTRLSEVEAAADAGREELATTLLELERLRGKLSTTTQTLAGAQADLGARDVQIAALTGQLNEALAQRVEELERYRSDFFGRLRKVLGEREDVRIQGDRFVLQSEVLFDTGEAELNQAGQAELSRLAETLLALTAEIPANVDWVLRVDGHTDVRPIRSGRFPSNWELSAARAISVVQYLISRGLPPERLAAAGFGQWQPIDPSETEAAYALNRRIELKLDSR